MKFDTTSDLYASLTPEVKTLVDQLAATGLGPKDLLPTDLGQRLEGGLLEIITASNEELLAITNRYGFEQALIRQLGECALAELDRRGVIKQDDPNAIMELAKRGLFGKAVGEALTHHNAHPDQKATE